MNSPLTPLALGEESVPPGEASHIDQLIAIMRSIQEEHDRKQHPVPRNVHSKQHGCVRAEFVIEPNLPAAFSHGLFGEVRTYAAVVRFSNSKQRNDELPDAHGMAVKLLEVEGLKLLEPYSDARTQDFVLVDHPVFFAKNVADMIPLAQSFRRLMIGGMFTKGRTLLKAAISTDYRFRLLRKMAAKRPESPLDIQYWTTTPSKLGEGAMKISFRPHLGNEPVRSVASADKLRLAMAAHLRAREARFDVLAQRQTDPVMMPIEDPTVAWDESDSRPTKVATLIIPPQDFESSEKMTFGDALSFTPWHALAAHRPLGGINRARRSIYEAMAERRSGLNGVPKREPTLEEVRTLWSGI